MFYDESLFMNIIRNNLSNYHEEHEGHEDLILHVLHGLKISL